MDIKVAFIGNDNKYFDKLWEAFVSGYENLSLTRIDIDITKADAKSIFIELYDSAPKIIYIDFSEDFGKAFSLSKFINKNNELRDCASVGLFEYAKGMGEIKKALNSELRLYHFKSLEVVDVVYDPISILDVNLTQEPQYSTCQEFDDISIYQPMRIGFVGDNHFHIETNSYLKVGEILEIDTHPLIDIMPSRKVFISNFSDRDIYFNKRFSYDLEFIYIDNDYFSMTNKNWLLYKEYKDNPEKMNDLDKFTKVEVLSDMDRRKKAFKPIKAKIDKWIYKHKNVVVPKTLKIMVIDYSLDFMREVEGRIEDFSYSLNVQTKLTHDFYQIERTTPHLIVIKQDKVVNNDEMTKNILAKIKGIKDYQPYVIVFKASESEQKNKNKTYENIVYYEGEGDLETIRKMAKLVDEKLNITKVHNKVFPTSHDQYSLMFATKNVKVLKLTESIMFLHSSVEIPMWTIFFVQAPIPMILTVVPHREDDDFKGTENVYRCLINGVGEKEKAALRRTINFTIGRNNEES